MRDHDDLPYIVIERPGSGLTPFILGALIGAGAALLLAPRAGAETQEELRRGVRRVRSVAEGHVESARASVNRTRERLEDRIDTVRDTIETRAEHARDVLDSGRRVARNAREEIERRLSTTRTPTTAAASASESVDVGASEVGLDVVTDLPEEPRETPPDMN
jgi:gas vesicle protein